MRLEGFHVVWQEHAGIYLGELEPKPQHAYIPFAYHVWSNAPNVIQAAPVYRSAAEVEAMTNGLLDNWTLRPVRADLVIGGEVFASLRACMESGLPPWLAPSDLLTEAYCRTETPVALLQALARFRTPQAGTAEISWTAAPGGVQWSIRPSDRRKSDRLLSARSRRGLSPDG